VLHADAHASYNGILCLLLPGAERSTLVSVTRKAFTHRIEMFVEAPCFSIFSVHGKGAYSGYVRCLQRALHRVAQERFANALALPAVIDGEIRFWI
jgi:hypothetical protein